MHRSLGFFLLVLASPALAAPQVSSTTRLIPYAGTALDAGGSPLSGEVEATFALYEDRDGGAPLWRETQRVQPDGRGRYIVYLGTVTPVPQIAFSEERARWLAVSINGRDQDRVMLVAVPYALRAADADTLGGQPASSFVRSQADGRLETSAGVVATAAVDGTGVPGQLAKWGAPNFLSSSVISESATNRIGVGLADPTGGGVVDSVFTIRNFDNNTGFAVLNQSQARRFALNTFSSGRWALYDGALGAWHEGLSQFAGEVRIGLAAGARLSVNNTSLNGFAVFGVADNGVGVYGESDNGTGVRGRSTSGLAGEFIGNVTVSGTLTKGGGSFAIDHPLDPANKVLSHSFVESPDMMNVYNGNLLLDEHGEGWVTLPDWFEALNRDFRYQLTALGAPAPALHVASKVSGNRFKIAGGAPAGEVSWQVTGIRQDAWANAHRIEVEQDKSVAERGSYLHPKEHGHVDTTRTLPQPVTRQPASGPRNQ